MQAELFPVGDCALLAVCGSKIDEAVGDKVSALDGAVHAANLPGVVETVPAFASLLVRYDPLRTDYDTLAAALGPLVQKTRPRRHHGGRVVTIPVCYGGDYGPDLAFVAQHAGLSEREVIRRHTAPKYRIYMLGFLPGFPYLGGLDPALFTPRLQNPRTAIPAGSVGIGGQQTGIYPVASPGGWQLIGRTPLKLFDPDCPLRYAAGNRIRFAAITPQQFETLAQKEGTV